LVLIKQGQCLDGEEINVCSGQLSSCSDDVTSPITACIAAFPLKGLSNLIIESRCVR
jgi:hypothetical protein